MSSAPQNSSNQSAGRTVLAWPSSTATGAKFPEQSIPSVMARPNAGVCFSGGGARAYSAAWGQLRALSNSGQLANYRYMSGISGGSWAVTNFSFFASGQSQDDFLGQQVPPASIDRTFLDTLDEIEMGYAAARDFTGEFVVDLFDSLFGEFSAHEAWNYTVGKIYLEPYGLFPAHDVNKSHYPEIGLFTIDQTRADALKGANPDLNDYTIHTWRNDIDLPYPLVGSTVLPNATTDETQMPGFEASPLYVGRRTAVSVPGTPSCIGGGWQEGAGHGGVSPSDAMGWGGKITESIPSRPFSLADMAGTSSSAYAEKIIQYLDWKSLDPDVPTWCFNDPSVSGDVLYGDGGIIDNYGIMPMLARQVGFITVFINTSQKLSTTYDPTRQTSGSSDDPAPYIDSCLPALFGFANKDWAFSYPMNTVFDASLYAPVVQEMQQIKLAGQIPFAFAELDVLENSWWGIEPYQAIVMFVYLDRGDSWIGQLSPEIQKLLETWEFKDFPNYETISQDGPLLINLEKSQVNLLSQFTGSIYGSESAFAEKLGAGFNRI